MAAINGGDTTTPHSPPLPFKTRLHVTLLSFVTDLVRRNNGTINRRLMNFLDRRTPPSFTPRKSISTHDVIIDPSTNLSCRLFIPHSTSSSHPLPLIIFFHGGGFAFLGPASYVYDAVCRRLSRKLDAVICSVDYRLTPENKFPSQYDDGISVLRFLDQRKAEIPCWPGNCDVSPCFLAGDSAGGNIAHHVAVRASQARLHNVSVIGLICIQPFFGGKERVESEIRLEGAPVVSMDRTDWMWDAFLPNGLDKDHWAVNVSGPNAVDISGLDYPATLVFVGGFDPLRDWQKRYYEWVKKSGKEVKLVDYPTAIHAFYVFPELPESRMLVDEVKCFIHQQCCRLQG